MGKTEQNPVPAAASIIGAEKPPDFLGGKAARVQESRLFGLFAVRRRQTVAELSGTHFRDAKLPVDTGRFNTFIRQFSGNTALVQFPTNVQRAETVLDAVVDIGLGKTPVALQTLRAQLVDNRPDDVGRKTAGPELALQFRSAVLALREEPQRTFPCRRDVRGQASAVSSAGSRRARSGSARDRMASSSCRAISGLAFRYSRALSLPWPIRSPL
jgi:hypothetical protein